MSIVSFLQDNGIRYSENVPLDRITGMSILGSITLLAKPSNISQLVLLYDYVLSHSLSYIVIGGLTNTYLCSFFSRDIVIQITNVKDICQKDDELIVGCGYSLTKLAKEVSSRGIAGYEGFIGIPGTIGAAAINNSGAFGSVMSDIVISVLIYTSDGSIKTLSNKELNYSTRGSVLKKNDFGILLSVTIDISKKDSIESILNRIDHYSLVRKRDIDGTRKSLGSIVAGHTIQSIWEEHKFANRIRQVLYLPFKNTRLRKKAQCVSEFIALGGARFIRHCDNIGRFCWTKDTKEEVFFDYLEFIKRKSNNRVELEIEIKR